MNYIFYNYSRNETWRFTNVFVNYVLQSWPCSYRHHIYHICESESLGELGELNLQEVAETGIFSLAEGFVALATIYEIFFFFASNNPAAEAEEVF